MIFRLPPIPHRYRSVWNDLVVEANGSRIKVTLNGTLVNDYQSSRQQSGHIALQAHDFQSRAQFRNLLIKKLP
jgi:hypothetical protein